MDCLTSRALNDDDGVIFWCVAVKCSERARIHCLLSKYESFSKTCLQLTYVTLGDYLWLLKGISNELNSIGSRALLYLAAAVSDFYIPKTEMVSETKGR